jgi:hypothetical protein
MKKAFLLSFLFILAALMPVFAKDQKSASKESEAKPKSKVEKNLLYLDLPEIVRKTLDAKVRRSDILEITKYEKDKKVFYAVKLKTMDRGNLILIDEYGFLLKKDGTLSAKKDQDKKIDLHKRNDLD